MEIEESIRHKWVNGKNITRQHFEISFFLFFFNKRQFAVNVKPHFLPKMRDSHQLFTCWIREYITIIHSKYEPLQIEFSLTLVMLNKLRCHAHFQFSANQITWSRLLIQIHILNGKQCRSRSVGFFRSQLIWIYTVCKGRAYPDSAGLGLRGMNTLSREATISK